MTAGPPSELRRIRQQIRQQRRALPSVRKKRAAQLVLQRLLKGGWLRPGSRLAAFLPLPEELDISPVLQWARRHHCQLAFPKITNTRSGRMVFYAATHRVSAGPWGIQEPANFRHCAAWSFDAVLVPLVGFDARGTRIGMGKGFYDRHFAFRLRATRLHLPLLIGIGYDFQQVPQGLPRFAHDVPLDVVVTDRAIFNFRRPRVKP